MTWNDIWNGDTSQYTSFYNYFVDFCVLGVKSIFVGKNGIDGPTWFLFALFWCKIGTDLILRNKYLIFVYFVIYALTVFGHNLIFIRQGCMALPFYLIGFIIKKRQYDQIMIESSLIKRILISIGLMIGSFIFCRFNGRVSMVGGGFGQFPKYISFWIFYLNGLLGSFSILILSTLFRENKWIKKCALSLITILCAQNFFVYTFKHFSGWWNYLYNELWISLLFMIACVLIHDFLDKYLPMSVGKGFSNKRNIK